jgi:RNA polymerase sigma-70 factor (ECF subfamily)
MTRSDTEDRFASFLDQYGRMIRAVVSRIGGRALGLHKEDVEQEIRLALWRRLQGEQSIEHPTSYVYTVARREAIRAVRRELSRSAAEGSLESDRPPPPDPHEEATRRETGRRLRAAVERLAPDRRRAIEAHLSGLDVDEIMDLFGWSYQKARNLIARGRADVRALLEEKEQP